jgi:hypothetical protein
MTAKSRDQGSGVRDHGIGDRAGTLDGFGEKG